MGNHTTDSNLSEDRILLGVIVSAHGVKGQFKVKPFTSEPRSIASYGKVVMESGQVIGLQAKSIVKGLVLCASPDITSREQAEQLKGLSFSVSRSALPALTSDELYHADIIGMQVISPDGTELGKITALHNFGAGDVVEIQQTGAKTTSFLPFYAPFLMVTDLAAGQIIIDSQSV